jgi:hypothetical protein
MSSPRNATRHGLLMKNVVLQNESDDGFRKLMRRYEEHCSPPDRGESGMVEELASLRRQLRRAWAITNELSNNGLEIQPGEIEKLRLAKAWRALSNSAELNRVHRHEARLNYRFQRAFQNLIVLHAKLPNEPGPISGHWPVGEPDTALVDLETA